MSDQHETKEPRYEQLRRDYPSLADIYDAVEDLRGIGWGPVNTVYDAIRLYVAREKMQQYWALDAAARSENTVMQWNQQSVLFEQDCRLIPAYWLDLPVPISEPQLQVLDEAYQHDGPVDDLAVWDSVGQKLQYVAIAGG